MDVRIGDTIRVRIPKPYKVDTPEDFSRRVLKMRLGLPDGEFLDDEVLIVITPELVEWAKRGAVCGPVRAQGWDDVSIESLKHRRPMRRKS